MTAIFVTRPMRVGGVPSPAWQRRKRNPEQAHPLFRGQQRFEQAEAQTLKVHEIVDRVADGLASRDLLKIGELDLQRQSPSPDTGRLAMSASFGDNAHRRERVQVLREGVLRANRQQSQSLR